MSEHLEIMTGTYAAPEGGFVLFDMDGTLCDIRHRLKYIARTNRFRDWKNFFGTLPLDKPIYQNIVRVEEEVRKGREVVIVSARPEHTRMMTYEWLRKHRVPFVAVMLRADNDMRPDDVVKREIYEKYFLGRYPVHRVYDDRPRVVRMWRSLGLETFDCGDGRDF